MGGGFHPPVWTFSHCENSLDSAAHTPCVVFFSADFGSQATLKLWLRASSDSCRELLPHAAIRLCNGHFVRRPAVEASGEKISLCSSCFRFSIIGDKNTMLTLSAAGAVPRLSCCFRFASLQQLWCAASGEKCFCCLVAESESFSNSG